MGGKISTSQYSSYSWTKVLKSCFIELFNAVTFCFLHVLFMRKSLEQMSYQNIISFQIVHNFNTESKNRISTFLLKRIKHAPVLCNFHFKLQGLQDKKFCRNVWNNATLLSHDFATESIDTDFWKHSDDNSMFDLEKCSSAQLFQSEKSLQTAPRGIQSRTWLGANFCNFYPHC